MVKYICTLVHKPGRIKCGLDCMIENVDLNRLQVQMQYNNDEMVLVVDMCEEYMLHRIIEDIRSIGKDINKKSESSDEYRYEKSFDNLAQRYLNVKVEVKGSLIMKASDHQIRFSRQVRFDSTTDDGSLVDIAGILTHSNQYVTLDAHQLSLYLYRVWPSDVGDIVDTTFIDDNSPLTYTLTISNDPHPLTPPCQHGKMLPSGQCQCPIEYALSNCAAGYQLVGDSEVVDVIDSGETHYYYYHPMGESHEEVVVSVISDEPHPNILLLVEQAETPSTIASMYNHMDSYTNTVGENEIVLISIYQPQDAPATHYELQVSLAGGNLEVIILFSLAGILALIMLITGVICCCRPTNSSGQKNIIANVQLTYEHIFPPISYQLFSKNVGNVNHSSCVVCLEDYSMQSMVKFTFCAHLIHATCLNQWLVREQNCPLCRESFSDENLVEWEQNLNLDLERDFQKCQKEKKKKPREETVVNMDPTVQPSHKAVPSENPSSSQILDDWAIKLYTIIYNYHKKRRFLSEDAVFIDEHTNQEMKIVFDSPRKTNSMRESMRASSLRAKHRESQNRVNQSRILRGDQKKQQKREQEEKREENKVSHPNLFFEEQFE